MDEIHMEKERSHWLSLSFCLDIASTLFNCLLFPNKYNSRNGLECAADLDDADMLLHEYFGYTICSSNHIDE